MKSNKLYYIIASMRPKQWTKNSFAFAGLIFSKHFIYVEQILRAVAAFALFSLVSGSVYIINDVVDRDKDKLHPRKSKRPIASGKVKPAEAVMYAFIVLAAALVLAFMLDFGLFLILASYFVLVCAYSLKLKNVVILDVIIISMGFVLRTVGGAMVIDVKISPWLIVCTTLLALFLALNKRKNELLVLTDKAVGHRKILEQYTPELIDQMLSVVTSTTVMSYSLYTFSAGKSYYMMLTIPFVLYGIFRYQYLAENKDMGGSPELVLLKDKPLLINIALWVITSLIIVANFY
jgi:4-hydroxybenzoate polyprenyltransferase